ncbi:MAG: hypothetical protein CR982_02145 [Candidatus Cloacimonadota bacterium]|nr:MAG: hypothetical protein CR982_02145 [Candidatus Cloacimonadota bacterium]
MKRWVINPSYFTDDDILREYEILKKGFDPTLFGNFSWEYHYRLLIVCAEIKLRGLIKDIDLPSDSINNIINNENRYSESYILDSYKQYDELRDRYLDSNNYRISPPSNIRELWVNHKYSIMARNIPLYKEIGRFVAQNRGEEYFSKLHSTLTKELRKKPKRNGILNALQHMWGYISNTSSIRGRGISSLDLHSFLIEIQNCVKVSNQDYLYKQLALSELEIWILAYND